MRFMPKIISFTIFSVISLLAINPVTASIITVDDNMEADYTSIQDAIDNAMSGDLILVSPGEYVENVDVNKELTIMSKFRSPENTTVRAATRNDDVFDVTANNVSISGFMITGANTGKYGEDKAGIYFEGGYGLNFTGNTVTQNNLGIFLIDSWNNTITNNNINNNKLTGVWLWNSKNNIFRDNVIKSNKNYGIFLWETCPDNELSSNFVTNNGWGINVDNGDNCTINSNVAINNDDGIFVARSDNITLTNNTANSNEYNGIYLAISNDNLVKENTANYNGDYGIYLHRCLNNKLINNNASGNKGFSGIYIGNYSRNNVLIGNIALSNNNTDLFIVEMESNTMFTEEPGPNEETQINDSDNKTATSPVQKVPSLGLTLVMSVFLVAYACSRKKL